MALGMITDVRVEVSWSLLEWLRGREVPLTWRNWSQAREIKPLQETEGQAREQGCSWEVRLWGRGLEMGHL